MDDALPPERPDEQPEAPERPAPPTPEEVARRLRSRLPVSPLPWRWGRRLRRIALVVAIVAVIGGGVASVVLQNESESSDSSPLPAHLSPAIKKTLGRMSPEDKVDQVLVVGIKDPGQAEVELHKAQLGGVLVTSRDWPSASAGKALTAKLRAAGSGRRRIGPLIAVQQEGGDYRSLADLPPSESELEIGETFDPSAAQAWALETGKSLEKHGFDLNLAPVADVATLDSPVADRAFGDDPRAVAELTAAAVRGCEESGIACAVSHFPGLGGASQDTAVGPATVGLDEAALEARDLLPFQAAIKAKVPAVVLSLAFYAAYDPVTPGALAPAITDGLLRDQLGFKGVAITDDLSSGAIAAGQGAPEAARSALAAGADLIVVGDPADAKRARTALLQAARSGSIPADRLDQAVARILALKRKLGLLPRA